MDTYTLKNNLSFWVSKNNAPMRKMAITLLWVLMVVLFSKAQNGSVNLAINADPIFNVSLTNLPPLGCGASKASFCDNSTNNCYTQAGKTDKVIFDGFQGVHLIDLSGPDTIEVKISNTQGILHTWADADLDVNNGEDNFVELKVLQANPSEFEAQLILNPTELDRESEQLAKIHTLSFTVISNYAVLPNQFSKYLEINIPFAVLGPTHDLIDPIGVTSTPKIPYLVLHDPPGDGSSSKFLSSKQSCRSFSTSYLQDASARVWGRAKLGFETSGAVPVEIYAQYEVGLSVGLSHSSQTETELCITTTSEFGTSDLDQNTGSSGDIFIGSGRTLAYGIAETLIFDPDNCSTKLEKALAFKATGQQERFTMTEQQIRNDIINQQRLVDDPANSGLVKSRARSQIKAWEKVLAINEANKMQALNFPQQTVTFSGQTSQSLETEITTTNIQTIETTVVIGADVALEVGAEVQGTGVAGGVEIEIRNEFGQTTTTAGSDSKVISYTLTDDDPNDAFNIRIGTDPMYGTPVFALNENSSSTSCPYEGGIQIDKPLLTGQSLCSSGKNILIENVPVGTGASLNLNVCNQSNIARTYYLALDGSSNVNGAKFNFSGTELNATSIGENYTLQPGECFTNNGNSPLLVVTQNPANPNILNYENMVVYLYPLCEGTALGELPIADKINLSVSFVNDPNAVPKVTIDGVADDLTPPTITSCPPSRTVNNFPGACGERITYNLPTAVDNCSAVTVTKIAGPNSNDNFFPGTTPVTFQLSDQSGNTATCSFTVTVIDNEPPQILNCPENRQVNVAPGACSEIISYEIPNFFDNCAARIERTEGPASGANFFPGTTTVTHTIIDNSNNRSFCTFTVTVIDNEAPVITSCPENMTIDAVSGNCSQAVSYTLPTAVDNCSISASNRTEGPASGEQFFLGTTTVTHTFSDQYNNSSSCSFQVTVVDNQSPSITSCPDSVVVTTALDQCSAAADWEIPTAVDNCEVTSTTSTAEPGALFDVGRHSVTYTFSDALGQASNCTFEVIVNAGDTNFCEGVNPVKEFTRETVAFQLMPNPAGERVMVNFTSEERATALIALFDASGRRVQNLQLDDVIGQRNVPINLTTLPQGVYIIRLQLKDPSGLYQENRKLVVSR